VIVARSFSRPSHNLSCSAQPTRSAGSNRFANPKTSWSRSLPNVRILPLWTAVVYKEYQGEAKVNR